MLVLRGWRTNVTNSLQAVSKITASFRRQACAKAPCTNVRLLSVPNVFLLEEKIQICRPISRPRTRCLSRRISGASSGVRCGPVFETIVTPDGTALAPTATSTPPWCATPATTQSTEGGVSVKVGAGPVPSGPSVARLPVCQASLRRRRERRRIRQRQKVPFAARKRPGSACRTAVVVCPRRRRRRQQRWWRRRP